ncbi:MAG TPA: hypothetical protein VKN99_04730 [Polyangia bacterium]|nr:hypothetical protein [Polyangia bacterium]
MATEPPVEFSPYRKALQAIVAFVTVGSILYLLASIAVSVFSRRQVHLRRAPITGQDLDDLLTCQSDVEKLFREINERTFDLQARAAVKEVDLAQHWEEFSKRWHEQFLEVGQRCRFVELRDRGLGTAFDRLAYAHADLEDVEHKFATLLRNYIDDQVPTIEDIRRSLEASRRGLEAQKRRQEAPPQAGTGGAMKPR